MVVDSSALMAIVQKEPGSEDHRTALAGAGDAVMSAGTLAEVLLVADQRGLGAEMRRLITLMAITIIPVMAGEAYRVADAHACSGSGMHPAGLNFGDCFAYALAR